MNRELDWDDYRVVLLIAEAGSLSGAAGKAAVSHPTMFRRINAIEDKLGVRLFERFRSGYQPTLAGEEVVAVARRIAELTNETERRIEGRDLRPSGRVRIATTDSLLVGLLSPDIARFRRLEPDITLEIAASNAVSDLSLREADIAIRPTSAPDPHLVGRKLGAIRHGLYAGRSFELGGAALHDLRTRPWLGPGPSMAYGLLHAWMKENRFDAACVYRADTVLGLYAAAREGVGLAVLPCYLAEQDRELVRIGSHADDIAVDLWLLTHSDLRHTARVRAALDHFAGSGHIRTRLDRRAR